MDSCHQGNPCGGGNYKAPIHANAVWHYKNGGYIPAPAEWWMPTERHLASQATHRNVGGFSPSSSADGAAGEQYREPTEDEIAEKIFSWWISGKSYKKWYAETYLQLKIDFKD